MTDHAMLSPSKRFQFSACPGSVREQARFPDGGSGPAAVDGTHSHRLLEIALKMEKSAASFIGSGLLTDHEGTFTVEKDRAARVQVALNYVAENTPAGATVLSETRVDPAWLIGRKDMGGTVDIQIHAAPVLELIDYKDGMNDAWDSAVKQMEQYAVGVLAGFKLPINGTYPFATIRLTVIQPKLTMRGGVAIRSKDYSLQQILDMIPVLVLEGAATDAPDAPLVPGESQCKYCRAKGSCSALASNVMKEIGVMFQSTNNPLVPMGQLTQKVATAINAELNSPVFDVAQQSANKDPNTMSDQQIREIMEAAPLMRQLLDGVEAEALRRFQVGQVIPGFKAVYGRGSRAWALSEDEMADRLIKMGVPKGSVWETKLVSPAKAEKLTWEKTKAGEKVKAQLSERQLKTLEQEYITKLAGKLTIVPESDSRPAVVLNAAPMFSAVETPASLPAWLL